LRDYGTLTYQITVSSLLTVSFSATTVGRISFLENRDGVLDVKPEDIVSGVGGWCIFSEELMIVD